MPSPMNNWVVKADHAASAVQSGGGAPSGSRLLANGQKAVGVAMSAFAITLLVFPFGMYETSEILTKMMVAMIFGFCGTALWQASSNRAAPEIELDTANQEIRIVKRDTSQRRITQRVQFHDIDRVKISGANVRIWAGSLENTLQFGLHDVEMRTRFRDALKSAGLDV